MYLILAPDYTGSCIRDEFNGPIELSSLKLPIDLENEINKWHLRYRKIIPLSDNERLLRIHEIEALDKIGIELAKKIANSISDKIKIRYFSEGKLKFIPIDF